MSESLVDLILARTIGRDSETAGRFLALAGALGVGLFVSIETMGVPLEPGWMLAGFELLPVVLLSFGLAAYSAYSNGGVSVSIALVAVPAYAITIQQNFHLLANVVPEMTVTERVRHALRPTVLAACWFGLPAFLLGTVVRHPRGRQPADD